MPTESVHLLTCGVGLRLSASAKQVTKWYFTTTRRIRSGADDDAGLRLDGLTGPLSAKLSRRKSVTSGRVFHRPVEFRAHVGKVLFGLDPERYEELLRLLYWLRRPQVGEDIDPKKIAQMLGQSLPALPDQAVRQVGATLDELTAFGERIARREAALTGLAALARVYRQYAAGVTAVRARTLMDASNAHAPEGETRAPIGNGDGRGRRPPGPANDIGALESHADSRAGCVTDPLGAHCLRAVVCHFGDVRNQVIDRLRTGRDHPADRNRQWCWFAHDGAAS